MSARRQHPQQQTSHTPSKHFKQSIPCIFLQAMALFGNAANKILWL
jgi:hypothetical protein